MSASSDLQAAIVTLLSATGAIREIHNTIDSTVFALPILGRMTGEQENDILAGSNKQSGLCVFVLPVVEQEASSMQGGDLIFFDAAEVRVRIIEQPRMNPTDATAFDLKDDIITALHWAPKVPDTALGAILAHPLQLARKPVEIVEGIIEESKQLVRILDVIFIATYGFQPVPEGTVTSDTAGDVTGDTAGTITSDTPTL